MKEQIENQIRKINEENSALEQKRNQVILDFVRRTFELNSEEYAIRHSGSSLEINKVAELSNGTVEHLRICELYLKHEWSLQEQPYYSGIEFSAQFTYINVNTSKFPLIIIAGKIAETLGNKYESILQYINKKYDFYKSKIEPKDDILRSLHADLTAVEEDIRNKGIVELTEEAMSENGKELDFITIPITKNRVYDRVTNIKVLKETPKNVTLQLTMSERVEGEFAKWKAEEFVGKDIFRIIYNIQNK